MCQRKRSKLQYLEVKGPKYNVTEEKVRITMFVRIRLKFKCFKGKGPNCNIRNDNVRISVSKNKVQITMFVTKTSELQCS